MKKIASLLVCLLVLFSGVVSACAEEIVYPMEEGITLSYAAPEHPQVLALSTNWADTPFVQAWKEQTGVNVEVSYYTDFSLLVASGDYPDILVGQWNTAYSGGIDRAIEDGVIVPINDYIEEYAPDYLAALESDPDYMKNARTAQGYIPGFYMLRSAPARNSYGAIVRQDWLDTLGMEVPTTLDEFYNMLVAFRDEMGATAPLSVNVGTLRNLCVYGIFTSPFNLVSSGYYHVDGTVHYGAAEEEFKDVLTWLNQLFNEGLLDANVLTLDSATMASNIMNGISGVAAGYASGDMGNWLTTMKDADPEFALAGMGSLVRNEGERAMFGQLLDCVFQLTAITTACEDVEAAVKFLNYGYTEAGYLLM
ncbi:MAG: extracellular solute-binding protein, partial [Clostridiales bacterium]|nr:extracellular solute-binding protein [Clostridiales bacterium]